MNCDAKAGNEEFSSMLDAIYDVSVEILPEIDPAIKDNPETKGYIERVKQGKETGIASMKSKIMGE